MELYSLSEACAVETPRPRYHKVYVVQNWNGPRGPMVLPFGSQGIISEGVPLGRVLVAKDGQRSLQKSLSTTLGGDQLSPSSLLKNSVLLSSSKKEAAGVHGQKDQQQKNLLNRDEGDKKDT